MSSVITWNVRLDDEKDFTNTPERYLGTAAAGKGLNARLRLWNNRYGTSDEATLRNFAIRGSFSSIEDSALLKYCTLSFEGNVLPSQITGNHVIFTVPKTLQLKGTANNGLTSENKSHYADFDFSFTVPGEARIKENDLKDMYLEVIHI